MSFTYGSIDVRINIIDNGRESGLYGITMIRSIIYKILSTINIYNINPFGDDRIALNS